MDLEAMTKYNHIYTLYTSRNLTTLGIVCSYNYWNLCNRFLADQSALLDHFPLHERCEEGLATSIAVLHVDTII